ncbi:phospholipase A and acyltransferase 3-like [Dermochelys coriacea]|uniref:phospholipase A and acyltransferase 3-like n=1 Tax=Dermochelys coriacea TaxID=27794 RepID=UPI001CA844C3|nr:phospholipase A and acyltransferase 3-like [Dermochelys coriacea]
MTLAVTERPDLGSVASGSLASINGQVLVKKQRLKRVVGNCNYWVNNKHDKTLQVYPVPRIIAQVNKRVGEKRTYKVLAENSKHFANEMHYNKAISDKLIMQRTLVLSQ